MFKRVLAVLVVLALVCVGLVPLGLFAAGGVAPPVEESQLLRRTVSALA